MAKKSNPFGGEPKIDYKAIEKRGSMGKFDMFEAGRREARKMSKKYRKSHGRQQFKWRM